MCSQASHRVRGNCCLLSPPLPGSLYPPPSHTLAHQGISAPSPPTIGRIAFPGCSSDIQCLGAHPRPTEPMPTLQPVPRVTCALLSLRNFRLQGRESWEGGHCISPFFMICDSFILCNPFMRKLLPLNANVLQGLPLKAWPQGGSDERRECPRVGVE